MHAFHSPCCPRPPEACTQQTYAKRHNRTPVNMLCSRPSLIAFPSVLMWLPLLLHWSLTSSLCASAHPAPSALNPHAEHLQVLTAEAFPTALRATGFGLVSACSRIAGLLTPFVAGWLWEISRVKALTVYASTSLACALALRFFIRDTTYLPLQDAVPVNPGGCRKGVRFTRSTTTATASIALDVVGRGACTTAPAHANSIGVQQGTIAMLDVPQSVGRCTEPEPVEEVARGIGA